MKKLALLILMFSVAFGTYAQSDARSKSILKKTSRVYKSMKSIEASFSFTTSSAKRKPIINKGKLWLKGKSFKLELGDQEIMCDGKSIWTYSSTTDEVTLESYSKRTNQMSPEEMFSFYEKGFKSLYEGKKTDGGKPYELIKLVPKKKRAKYSYIHVEINPSNNYIHKVTQHMKNGMEIVIEITDFKRNARVSSNLFTWDSSAHPGVALVDLR